MSANHKLSSVLRDEEISGWAFHPGSFSISFASGKALQVLSSSPADGRLKARARVSSALEEGGALVLHLGSGQVRFKLSDPGGSVMVRDGEGHVVYAG